MDSQPGFFQRLSEQQFSEETEEQTPDNAEPRTVPHKTVSDRGADAPVSLDEKAAMLYAAILAFLAGQVDFAQWEGPPPSNYGELYRILRENGTVIDDDQVKGDVEDPRMEDLDYRISVSEHQIPEDYRSLVDLMVVTFIRGDRAASPEDNELMKQIVMEKMLPDTEEKFLLDLLVCMKTRKLMYEQLMSDMGPLAAILGLSGPNK